MADRETERIVWLRLHGYSPERVAELVGRAAAYVREVLRDRRLCS